MVDHEILLNKLHHYGIRGTAHTWLASYLADRSQYVSIEGKHSTTRPIKFGVPQGSILGPLLFIIYINDIPEINHLAKFILYADDANIIITGNSLSEIEIQFDSLSSALTNWVSTNGLSLNIRKTNYMIFTRKKQLDIQNFKPKMNNIPIEQKRTARFLGVLIDDQLTWKNHISAINSKMSKYVGILYKLKNILPLKARILIFHSFVQSQLNYCSLVWGLSAKFHIESLFTTQKKAMRAIMPGYTTNYFTNDKLPTHTKPAFTDYDILTVQNIILKNIMIHMHKTSKGILPFSVLQTIPPNAPVPGSTHETCTAWLDIYGTDTFKKSIFFKGPLLYNELSCKLNTNNTLINDCRTLYSFKNIIKKHLLATQKEGDSEIWNNFKIYHTPGLRKSSRTKNT